MRSARACAASTAGKPTNSGCPCSYTHVAVHPVLHKLGRDRATHLAAMIAYFAPRVRSTPLPRLAHGARRPAGRDELPDRGAAAHVPRDVGRPHHRRRRGHPGAGDESRHRRRDRAPRPRSASSACSSRRSTSSTGCRTVPSSVRRRSSSPHGRRARRSLRRARRRLGRRRSRAPRRRGRRHPLVRLRADRLDRCSSASSGASTSCSRTRTHVGGDASRRRARRGPAAGELPGAADLPARDERPRVPAGLRRLRDPADLALRDGERARARCRDQLVVQPRAPPRGRPQDARTVLERRRSRALSTSSSSGCWARSARKFWRVRTKRSEVSSQ